MTIPLQPSAPPRLKSGHVELRLYPHDPASLIGLLEAHTPRSLPALCTIRENLDRPGSSSFSSGRATEYDVAYTTFQHIPANDEGGERGPWAVVVQMQDPAYTHLRLFTSLEPESEPIREDGSRTEISIATAESETGQEWMRQLAMAIVRTFGQQVILGAVESCWNEAMRGPLDAEEAVECATFLAPLAQPQTGAREEEEVETMGLKFDHARPDDINLIQRTCDVPRPRAYYLARAPHTTVLRTSATSAEGQEGEAVCWIMHHSDGALGALYTVPEWRRKGLARLVITRRLAERRFSTQGKDPQQYCHVFRGNHASESLWLRMGWKAAWGVKWVVNRELDRQRGKVVIHRDEHHP